MSDESNKVPRFALRDFQVASFLRNEFRLDLTEAQTIEHVTDMAMWRDLMGKVKRGDTVEAFKADTGDWAKFVVTEAGPGFVKLGKIESFTPAHVEIPDGPLKAKWNVGKRAFDVIRTDGFVMSSGHQTKGAAAAWIEDHNKKMAA